MENLAGIVNYLEFNVFKTEEQKDLISSLFSTSFNLIKLPPELVYSKTSVLRLGLSILNVITVVLSSENDVIRVIAMIVL